MSTSASTPRFICRAVRSWRQADTAIPTSGMLARHVAGCSDCRKHFAALRSLEKDLRQEARVVAEQEVEIPVGIEDRIFAAVRPIVREKARVGRGHSVFRWMPALSAMAAAVALTMVVWTQLDPVANEEALAEIEDIEFGEEDLRELASSLEDYSQRMLTASFEVTSSAQDVEYLANELEALRSDTESTLRFLERSFLPGELWVSSFADDGVLSEEADG